MYQSKRSDKTELDAQLQVEAIEGKKRRKVTNFSTVTGKLEKEYDLDSPPVWDGMEWQLVMEKFI